MAPQEAAFPFPWDCASGMISSSTTYTMAPAANAKAYGRIGAMKVTRAAPITPAIGSTMPDSCPYQTARAVEIPAAFRGKETAIPSGKFWIPIPTAKFLALSNVADLVLPTAPNPTPTARPSGMLWTVIATIRRRILLHLCSWSTVLSMSSFSSVTVMAIFLYNLHDRCNPRLGHDDISCVHESSSQKEAHSHWYPGQLPPVSIHG